MKTRLYTAVLALLLATSADAGAATKTWTGAINNNWHEPGNWSPPGVPAGNDTINIAGASVNATPPVTIASGGTLNLTNSSSSIYGGLTIASGAVLNLAGTGPNGLYAGVTNAGIIRWSSGDLWLLSSYGSIIVNQPGGLFDAQSDQTISSYLGQLGIEPFVNEGEFRKSAGNGTTTVAVPFTNTTGTVQALSGTISLNAGGPFEGTFHAASGTAIQLAAGTFSYSTLPTLTGPGAIQLAGGATLTLVHNPIPGLQMVSGTVILSPAFQGGTITNLTLPGVTLSGNYTVSGTFSGNGAVQGDLTVASGATVNRAGGNLFGNHTIANRGTLNWTGAGGGFYGGLTIASGGVLNLAASEPVGLYAGVTNAGIIRGSGGDLYLGYGSSYGSVIVNQPGGLYDAQSDHTIVCPSCFGTEAVLNAGVFRKSAGSGTTGVGVPFTNTTGTVEAHTGTIAFQSSFHQTPAATLAISIGGPTPGTDYGHIRFAQPLVLDGTFTATNRNAYLPNPGDTFNVLSYPSFTGEFTCLRGIDLGGGIVLFPAMHPKGMTLTAASSAPNAPTIFVTRWAGGVRLLRPQGFSDWEFVATTNLFAPVWTPVPSTGCDQVTLPVTTPQQYFRLRKNN